MKKFVCLAMALAVLCSMTSALADYAGSKAYYASVPIINENESVVGYDSHWVATFSYRWRNDYDCAPSLTYGASFTKKVYPVKRLFVFAFNGTRYEFGYKPSWSSVASFEGSVTVTKSDAVRR